MLPLVSTRKRIFVFGTVTLGLLSLLAIPVLAVSPAGFKTVTLDESKALKTSVTKSNCKKKKAKNQAKAGAETKLQNECKSVLSKSTCQKKCDARFKGPKCGGVKASSHGQMGYSLKVEKKHIKKTFKAGCGKKKNKKKWEAKYTATGDCACACRIPEMCQ